MNIADWFRSVAPQLAVEDPTVDEDENDPDIRSVVRITFNRPLTWAEREHFYEWHRYYDPVIGWVWKQYGKQLYISSSLDSRELVADIQDFVATEYLNVFPRAAYTIYPEVRV